MFSWFSAVVRASSEDMDGQDIPLEEGSIERGSRVNVESILVEEGSGCARKTAVRVQSWLALWRPWRLEVKDEV